jgi:hypothetical protein
VSDPQLTPGRVNPAAAPGVAHAPPVGAEVVVRIAPNARPKRARERTPCARQIRSPSQDIERAETRGTTGVQTCETARPERLPGRRTRTAV